MAAGTTSQIATTAIQIVSIPLFLKFWSIEQYGEWILISALPAYFALADAGMLSAIGTTVVRLVGNNQLREARKILHTGCVSGIAVVALILCVASTATQLLVDLSKHAWPLMLLVIGACVAQLTMLTDTVFRANHKYHTSTNWQTAHRIFEFSGQMTAISIGGGLTEAALYGTGARIVSSVAMWIHANQTCTNLKLGMAEANWKDWKELLRPALHYCMFPITGSLVFQGSTLIVGSLLGPTSAAIFSTYRTVSRSLVQVVGIISNTIAAEIAPIIDKQTEKYGLREIYGRTQRSVIAITSAFSVAVILALPIVMPMWTSGRISYAGSVAGSAIAFAAGSALGHVPKNILLVAGTHQVLAWATLGAALTTCAVGVISTKAFGISGMFVALTFGELLVAAVATRQVKKLFQS